MTDSKDIDNDGWHFLKLFEKGRQFMEDLLRENERLRTDNASLRVQQRQLQNDRMKATIDRLEQQVQLFQEENRELQEECEAHRSQLSTVEAENREFTDRFMQVERLNSDLINMYVASCRLHSTVSYPKVLQVVKEILANIVGAFAFGIYVVDRTSNQLVLIMEEELGRPEGDIKPLEGHVLANVAGSGEVYIASNGSEKEGPVAAFPLKIGDRVVGVVVIERLLTQKQTLEVLDYQLFDFLGKHAAAAIYRAKLCSLLEQERPVPRGLTQLIQVDIEALG